jgi:hypothetical protein
MNERIHAKGVKSGWYLNNCVRRRPPIHPPSRATALARQL